MILPIQILQQLLYILHVIPPPKLLQLRLQQCPLSYTQLAYHHESLDAQVGVIQVVSLSQRY